ncbi:hypothetical protein ACFCT7_04330 [Fulvivirgaceae bacterium LMO-SS25]
MHSFLHTQAIEIQFFIEENACGGIPCKDQAIADIADTKMLHFPLLM